MTSDPNQTPPLLDDNIDEEDETEEDEELTTNNVLIEQNDDDLTTTASDPTLSVTIALPPPISPTATTPKLSTNGNDPIKVTPISSQPPGPDDQARKLFQRLWTDEDEIELLQGFLDYSTQRGTAQNNPHDTALFYDQIKSKLQLDFNKNQLVEKLRRLKKKKYRNVLARISSGKDVSFKSAHDQSTFRIACKIWGTASANSSGSSKDHQANLKQQLLQRRIDVDDDMPRNYNSSGTNINLNFATSEGYISGHYNDRVVVDERRAQHKSSKKRIRERTDDARVLMDRMGGTVPASSSHVQIPIWGSGMGLSPPVMTEEKAEIKISPLLREMYEGFGGRGFVDGIVSPVPLSFASPVNTFGMEGVDDRWKKQQIMELEVYSKRLDLVQEQVKLTLEQLRSMGN